MFASIKRKFFYLLVIVDALLVAGAILLSFLIRLDLNQLIATQGYLVSIPIVVFVFSTVLYAMGAYDIAKTFISIPYIVQYVLSFAIITLMSSILFYAVPNFGYGRGILIIYTIISFVLLLIWRAVFEKYIHKIEKSRIAIIGYDKRCKEIVNLINHSQYLEFAGYIHNRKIKNEKVLGPVKKLNEVVADQQLNAIIILDEFTSKDLERGVLDVKMRGLVVYNVPLLFEHLAEKLPVKHLNDFWIIFNTFAGINNNMYNNRIKRILDIGLSLGGLIVAIPFMALIALVIKISSKGPVFYKQTRVGYDENEFDIIKFRSMRVDAEDNCGAIWSEKNDPRITVVGRILRKLRLDELPQLLNILRADMTLIGPRPERPEFIKHLKKIIPYYSLRHVVKPGVTGWAQVNYRYGASVEDALEKLQFDLYYIRHLSLKMDLRIILRTIRVILFGIGAR